MCNSWNTKKAENGNAWFLGNSIWQKLLTVIKKTFYVGTFILRGSVIKIEYFQRTRKSSSGPGVSLQVEKPFLSGKLRVKRKGHAFIV